MPDTSRAGNPSSSRLSISYGETDDAMQDETASSSDEDDDDDDEWRYEPPAKRSKSKNKTRKKIVKRTKLEKIVKPPLNEEWSDIPDWKGKKESPLMELPVEVLDKIFCIRPELAPGDYLALAGTCRFFRDHMTNDFWEHVVFKYPEHRHPNKAGGPLVVSPPKPSARPLSASRPFSRTVTDWRVPHPKIALDLTKYPVVSSLRTKSKWKTTVQSGLPTDHRSGHYVPPGPRSAWSRAQYTIYKEEQASWRQDRNEVRSEGLKQRLRQHRKDLATEKLSQSKGTIQVELEDESGYSKRCLVFACANRGINYRDLLPNVRGDSGTIIDLTINDGLVIDLTENEELSAQGKEHGDESDEIDPTDGTWKVPDSESSDTEDEYQWLWDRGAKLSHDHWPSVWRQRVSDMVNKRYITLDYAMDQYSLTEWELSTLKSFEVCEHKNAFEDEVFNKRAVEARAMKFHGGPEIHGQYITAMIEQNKTAKRKKEEKHQRELRRLV